MINLLNDQKTVVRISPDKLKAVTDMLDKFSDKKAAPEKPKLTPTGRKETVNGYETEQYTYDGPGFKAIYWIAPDYPDGAAILANSNLSNRNSGMRPTQECPTFAISPGYRSAHA